jgi:hypothetical protein
MAEASDNFLSALRNLVQAEMVTINTSIDGVIVDYAGGFATVRPLGNKQFDDGDSLPYPNIYKVPVRWPTFANGTAGIKGPVSPGDKVQLIFAQQASDGSNDDRRFSLTDAYAIICSNSQAAQGANNDDMVMWFGSAYIKLTAAGTLEINAPGGTKTIAPTNEYTGNQQIDGSQLVEGAITGQGGFNISGGSSGTANITGNVNVTGTLMNNGKTVGSTHTHSGVQPGSGTSGAPV